MYEWYDDELVTMIAPTGVPYELNGGHSVGEYTTYVFDPFADNYRVSTVANGSDVGFGLAFRYRDGSHYLAMFWRNTPSVGGYVTLIGVEGLHIWPADVTGNPELAVVVQDNTYSAYTNGVLNGSYTDPEFTNRTGRKVGLFHYTDEHQTTGWFDYLKVEYELTNAIRSVAPTTAAPITVNHRRLIDDYNRPELGTSPSGAPYEMAGAWGIEDGALVCSSPGIITWPFAEAGTLANSAFTITVELAGPGQVSFSAVSIVSIIIRHVSDDEYVQVRLLIGDVYEFQFTERGDLYGTGNPSNGILGSVHDSRFNELGAGDKISIKVNGADYQVFVNDGQIGGFTSTTGVGAGSHGLYGNEVSAPIANYQVEPWHLRANTYEGKPQQPAPSAEPVSIKVFAGDTPLIMPLTLPAQSVTVHAAAATLPPVMPVLGTEPNDAAPVGIGRIPVGLQPLLGGSVGLVDEYGNLIVDEEGNIISF